jgi:hypothetical protein
MLKAKRFEDITFADVANLIEAAYAEDHEIDYKLALPEFQKRADDDRKELCKDVSAFASAGGGDILFGIEEGRDANNKPTGIPIKATGVAIENLDSLQLRWLGFLDSGLDPRLIPKRRFRTIDVPDSENKILLLRVPRSIAAPHMIKETGRFYVRHGSQSSPLNTSEIRGAFELAEGWARRVRTFRDERIARFVGEDRPVRVDGDAHMLLHIVPFSTGDRAQIVNLSVFESTSVRALGAGLSQYSIFHTFNVDGLLATTEDPNKSVYGYQQFFRDGSVELAVTAESSISGGIIGLDGVEERTINAVSELAPLLAKAGAIYPFAVVLTLSGVRGLKARQEPYEFPRPLVPMTRDLVSLNDVVIASEPNHDALDAAFKPMFDEMWQCFGRRASPRYKAKS